MSMKFWFAGPTYPTEVRNGMLRIFICNKVLEVALPWFKHDYPYQNLYYKPSTVLAYLASDTDTIILRFDGSMTKYNTNNEVVAFNRFDPKLILSLTRYLPIGCMYHDFDLQHNSFECRYRYIENEEIWSLESNIGIEAFQFDLNKNPELIEDMKHGTKFYPALVSDENGAVYDTNGKYYLTGEKVFTTGSVDV